MGVIALKITKLTESIYRYKYISNQLQDSNLTPGKRNSLSKQLKLIKEEIDSLVKDLKDRGSILKVRYKKNGELNTMLISKNWDSRDLSLYFEFLSLTGNEKYELVDYKRIQL